MGVRGLASLRRLALLSLALVAARPARGEEDGGAPDLSVDPARAASIFQYAAPQSAHPLRATLEIGAGFAYQFVVYLGRPSHSAVESEQLYYPRDKLLHGAWAFDANQARTNYGGHPLAGAFYYLVARGNRLGVLASSFAAVASSTLWEITEYHEQGSINDMVVTPVGGISIGEPLAQLSAFLEQRDAGGADRAFAWVFQPFKKAHDLWDGAAVARRPEALAWHGLSIGARAGSVLRAGAWSPEGGLALSSSLVRGLGYGAAGSGSATFADANATSIAGYVLAAHDGLTSARLESDVGLAGVYARDIGEGGAGHDVMVSVGMGYEVTMRNHDPAVAPDWWSLVRVPGVEVAWRSLGGAVPLLASVRGALTFGGIHSLVLAASPRVVPPADLPTAARAYGYYHAIGLAAAGRIEASPGPLRLGVRGRYDDLHGFDAGARDPEPVPGARPAALGDRRGEARGYARLSLGDVEVGVEVVREWAWGRVADAERSARTTDVLLTVEVVR